MTMVGLEIECLETLKTYTIEPRPLSCVIKNNESDICVIKKVIYFARILLDVFEKKIEIQLILVEQLVFS